MTTTHPARTRDRVMAARNLLSIAQAGPAIDAVQAAGIEVVVYKGAPLVELGLVPLTRPMADVDLLVRPRDRRRAERIIVDSGFLRAPAVGRTATARAKASGPPLCTRQGTQIDVHASLTSYRTWPLADIFANAVELRLGEVTTKRPSNEDLVLTIAIDHAKDGFFSSSTGARDLAAVSSHLAIDWPRVVARARRWRCTAALWVALRQAARVAGAPVPSWVLRRLRPNLVRRAYLESILDTRAAPAYRFQRHSIRLRQLVAGPALADDPMRYLAAASHFGLLRIRDALERPR